jgi:hypothetical protein
MRETFLGKLLSEAADEEDDDSGADTDVDLSVPSSYFPRK